MEPSDNFVFRSGEHAGKTYCLVKKTNPSYIRWIKENRPEMLVERKEKPKPVEPKPAAPRKEVPEDSEVIQSSIQPNLDFLNQKNDYQFYKKEDDGSNKS